MGRPVLDTGAPPDARFDKAENVAQGHRRARAEVDDLVAEGREARDRAARDVVDVREVPRLRPVAVQPHGTVLVNPLHEPEEAHVGPAGGAVHGEVAEDGDVEPEEMVIGVAEPLGRLLGGGVRAGRPARVRVLAVGHRAARIVEARGRRQHELRRPALAAEVQQVEGAGDVGVHAGPGVVDAGPDPGPGGEVDHAVDGRLAVARGLEGGAIRDIRPPEREALAGSQPLEAPVLEPDVVGVVQIVDAEDRVTAVQQLLGDRGPDEPRRSRQQIVRHVLTRRSRPPTDPCPSRRSAGPAP